MLKSLIVVIALMFTTAALAQGQCRSIGEVHRNLDRITDRVELVPADLPPLKWSSLKYVFRMEDKIDGKEEA